MNDERPERFVDFLKETCMIGHTTIYYYIQKRPTSKATKQTLGASIEHGNVRFHGVPHDINNEIADIGLSCTYSRKAAIKVNRRFAKDFVHSTTDFLLAVID